METVVEPRTLRTLIESEPFQGYAYAYPHKTAYRFFEEPLPLQDLWASEDRDSLFLYLHVPFCEMRCGFCNLFTTANPDVSAVESYLAALERQLRAVGESLGKSRFTRAAFGGGTPSYLELGELQRVWQMLDRHLGGIAEGAPMSFEFSPATISADKLAFLRERGVTRASMGVQSLHESEVKTLGRRQTVEEVRTAVKLLREAGFPMINLDLIYGIAGQTAASWRASLEALLAFEPEEIYLYPLYVRPLTGLGRRQAEECDRIEHYRAGRDLLLERGYRQISMRLFRRGDVEVPGGDGLEYCCQEDGMTGLGPGARSYTREVHYCTEYAVSRPDVMQILNKYCQADERSFAHAHYGYRLNGEEQRRRYVIKSLLRAEGLSLTAYREHFGTEAREDFPELAELEELGLLEEESGPVTGNTVDDSRVARAVPSPSPPSGERAGVRGRAAHNQAPSIGNGLPTFADVSALAPKGINAEVSDSDFGDCCGIPTCRDSPVLRLNQQGMEYSDVIGPWLYSETVRRQMEEYELH